MLVRGGGQGGEKKTRREKRPTKGFWPPDASCVKNRRSVFGTGIWGTPRAEKKTQALDTKVYQKDTKNQRTSTPATTGKKLGRNITGHYAGGVDQKNERTARSLARHWEFQSGANIFGEETVTKEHTGDNWIKKAPLELGKAH